MYEPTNDLGSHAAADAVTTAVLVKADGRRIPIEVEITEITIVPSQEGP